MTLQHLLGIDLPLIQAPMAGVQRHALAVAVCNAGGLGSLPCATLTPEALRAELAAISSRTARPFNVNFFCHVQPEPSASREAQWHTALAPYLAEYDVDLAATPAGPSRMPFGEESAEVLGEFRPAVVSFHFGLPSPRLLEQVRRWGAKILSTATTVDEARWLDAHGVDAVIAQGLEAGGHRGHFLSDGLNLQHGTFTLVPQVVDAVRVPVIAAGGIADARGVVAAMALGAAGVQVGTAYMLCHEAETSSLHRAAIKSARARDTALTNLFTGRPARGIVNRLMRELGPMSDIVPRFPMASAALAPLRAKAEARGSDDFSPLWAGQNAIGCKETSAADLTHELVSAL